MENTGYYPGEEFYFLGYNEVESQPTFLRNTSPPSSESKIKPINKPARSRYLHLGLFLGPDEGGEIVLRNVA
jgi:hypothetical protein